MAEAHVRSEAAIAEVVDLLTEMRQARGVARRGRFAVLATRAIAALTPEQRRQLAVDVASRAAPHLVEKIESESSVDLSPAQVRAVVEMVGNLDGDDVESLKAAIQDPEFQRQAASRVMGAADETLGSAGVELGTSTASLLPPPPEPEPPIEELTEDVDDEPAEGDAVDEMAQDDAADEPAVARPVSKVEPPDGPREPPAPLVTPETYDEYMPGLPEMADWRADGMDEAMFAFAPRQRRPAARREDLGVARDEGERSWFGGASLDVGPVEAVRTSLGDRLRVIERSSAQLRAVLDAADELFELSPGEQASVLRQVRAGWVRRRAVLALIEQGRIGKASAGPIIRAFDSPVDRAWIVASLVEAGAGDVADWADLLSPAAAARLERRYAA